MNENSSRELSPQGDEGLDGDVGAAFLCGKTLIREVTTRLEGLGATTVETLWPRVFSLSLFAKGYETYQAVQHLWSAGFIEDALALSRTLFEIELILKRIAAKPAEATAALLEG